MSEFCAFEAILIVTLRAAIEIGMRFSYAGELHYDPRDFSYWGA
ncbi:hypothetical protein [Rhizobium lusitanum]|nr:hypothetical protein [Rhizobium lusitanum]